MAIEFGSRKENFDNFKVYETTLAGRPFKVEMGKMCGLSNASALIRYGETCVMCNVVMSPKPREGVDFFPLNVEYEEKLYAAGRIPGSFMRREGRPGERAILTSRVVDRPMRPLFPKEMRNDVCITMTVMSLDPDCSPEIAGMIGASLVTAVSEIPWNGPIGGVQVGLVDGEIVLNPTQEQRKKSDLALTVAATMDKIVMIEAGANEVDEDTMLNAIKAAHVEIKKIITFINGIVAERGKPKIDFQVVGLDMDVFHAIKEKYLDDFKAAMDTDDKNVRDAALLPIMDKIAEEYPDLTEADLDLVSYKMQKYVVRRWLLDEGKRELKMFVQKEVVDEVENPGTQMSLDDAKAISAKYNVGDIVNIPVDNIEFGRIAAGNGKQVIIQGLREAESGMVYDEYNSKQHEILTGVVTRIDPRTGNASLRIGTGTEATDAILLAGEQVKGETLVEGQRIKVYLVDVRRQSRGPQVVISRTHPGLVKRLFELEVPEIYDGTVEIRSIAREAGSRTKMAVWSNDENVDPIGACVGPHGQRVNSIVEELRGEKIDIIKYSDDPAEYIAAALAPADVVDVRLAEEGKACRVIVPDDQLSLAIGKEGQNARLAARLVGYKIDIKPESYREEE